MSRKEQLQEIEDEFLKPLTDANDDLLQAQLYVNELFANRQIQMDEVNKYWDAVDLQEQINNILGNGAPVIAPPPPPPPKPNP